MKFSSRGSDTYRMRPEALCVLRDKEKLDLQGDEEQQVSPEGHDSTGSQRVS